MVEEFMLLANIYTAEKTRVEFPQSAVLRRHPSPPDNRFHPLIKVAQNKVLHSYLRADFTDTRTALQLFWFSFL